MIRRKRRDVTEVEGTAVVDETVDDGTSLTTIEVFSGLYVNEEDEVRQLNDRDYFYVCENFDTGQILIALVIH